MSETKRPASAPKGPKKKARPKSTRENKEQVAVAPLEDDDHKEVEEDAAVQNLREGAREELRAGLQATEDSEHSEEDSEEDDSRENRDDRDDHDDHEGHDDHDDHDDRYSDEDRGDNETSRRSAFTAETKNAAPSEGDRRQENHSENHYEDEEDFEPRHRSEPPPRALDSRPPQPTPKLSDEYTSIVVFDKQSKQFAATSIEFPEIRGMGPTRDGAMNDLSTRLENHLQNLKRRGEALPETLQSRRYPEVLDIRISQSLFRRLDILSRHEKVSLDQLVVELLSTHTERRLEGNRGGHQHHQPHHQGRPHQQHDRDRDRDRNRNRQPQGGTPGNERNPRHESQGRHQQQGQNRGRGRNYHDTMDNRENFMEYVRNLEKGGGTPGGGWRKK